MNKVLIYVEGPSDKYAMSSLLGPLISEKLQAGIQISFIEAPAGDKKKSVVMKVPEKAANILLNESQTIVIALPDLYPKNKGFVHETADELINGIKLNFSKALERKGISDKRLLESRFKTFCFKYDLEALILASPAALANRLGTNRVKKVWKIPVEEQNNDYPPKRVVEDIFATYHKRYIDTIDAPAILSKVSYKELANLCDQQFKPFVGFLEQL